jgi:hypothetical protein
MLRGERIIRNPRAREPVGNSYPSHCQSRFDAIAVIGSMLIR